MDANELHKKTAPGAALSDFQELRLDAERSCDKARMSCIWALLGAASKRRPGAAFHPKGAAFHP